MPGFDTNYQKELALLKKELHKLKELSKKSQKKLAIFSDLESHISILISLSSKEDKYSKDPSVTVMALLKLFDTALDQEKNNLNEDTIAYIKDEIRTYLPALFNHINRKPTLNTLFTSKNLIKIKNEIVEINTLLLGAIQPLINTITQRKKLTDDEIKECEARIEQTKQRIEAENKPKLK